MDQIGNNVSQYFTFGGNHPFAKFHVKITAASSAECRQIMFEMFDKKWAFQYDEAPDFTTELPIFKDEYGFRRLVLPGTAEYRDFTHQMEEIA